MGGGGGDGAKAKLGRSDERDAHVSMDRRAGEGAETCERGNRGGSESGDATFFWRFGKNLRFVDLFRAPKREKPDGRREGENMQAPDLRFCREGQRQELGHATAQPRKVHKTQIFAPASQKSRASLREGEGPGRKTCGGPPRPCEAPSTWVFALAREGRSGRTPLRGFPRLRGFAQTMRGSRHPGFRAAREGRSGRTPLRRHATAR